MKDRSTVTTPRPVPGLICVADYLSQAEQDELLSRVDAEPWSAELRRRVQHYGYRYDYRRRSVDPADFLGPLPDWATALANRLVEEGHAPAALDQLIVNEYEPGQGIADHVDCVPCFGDPVLSLSLGSFCVLTMTSVETGERVPVPLPAGSLLVLSGESRYRWRHGIAARKTDRFGGRTVPRGRRVSLTFRRVLLAAATA